VVVVVVVVVVAVVVVVVVVVVPCHPGELGTSDSRVETETVVHYESQHQRY